MVSKVVFTVLALFALTKASGNYEDVFPMPSPVVPHIPLPNGLPSGRIVGGEEVVPNSLPYQVGLFLPVNGGRAFCGGSLITPQTGLTAAHCVEGLIGPVEVVMGAHYVQRDESSQVRVETNNVVIHPDWNSLTLTNDLALVILPSPVELNAFIQTIPLASGSNTFVGAEALVSGWGRDSDQSTAISPVLRKVNIPIISNLVCNIAFMGAIQNTHICASGADGRSTCNGDSGGPLVVNGVQVGIVSFGIALGCEIGWPHAYTRVTSYNDWINSNAV